MISHRMRRSLKLFFLLVLASVNSYAKDRDTTRTRQSKELGLGVTALHSLAVMKADPYFIGDNVGLPEMQNTLGFGAGFYYNIYAGKSLIIRPGVEGLFLPIKIEYQTEINYKTSQRIYPTTLELPLTFLYSSYRIGAFPLQKGKPEFGLGIRPVITIRPLNDIQPVLKENNLNIDAVLGFPFGRSKSVMRAEVYFSFGMFNIIGEDDDYRTRNITSLYRHMGGLRLIFH